MSARLEDYLDGPRFVGTVVYEPGWYLLSVPDEAHAELLALVGEGVELKPAARPHVSVMKGEAPCRNARDWGTAFAGEAVAFRVAPVVHGENGLHLWVDCHSPRLCEMREHFGLSTLRREDGAYLVNFHLTVGRRKKAVGARKRPQLRLSPQSHIDVETGMQHL
ncbi:hypothetical protein ACQEVZ_35110 [Dactylosporangium sp. CA-152071]|uniref:hypothetical protein n=1 Tax=Dactylosporangium sp. CA-152071 TaxID=3239933 RepID=UPI003D89E9A2